MTLGRRAAALLAAAGASSALICHPEPRSKDLAASLRGPGRTGELAALDPSGGAAALHQDERRATTILIAGDTQGYLAPCGCTSPMSGGIVRMGTAIRDARSRGPVLLLYAGGFVEGTRRQDVLKAEALAQALGEWHVTAANWGASDAKLGEGELLNLARLSGGRIVSGSLAPSPSNPLEPFQTAGGYLIGGVTAAAEKLATRMGEESRPLVQAVGEYVETGDTRKDRVIVLLDGDRAAAADLARLFPRLYLIVYRSTGRPPLKLETVGSVALATPGERGQYFVDLSISGDRISSARSALLGPKFADDPATLSLYRTYLGRVRSERLWEKTPRLEGPGYAGSAKCGSCHLESYRVWSNSGHAHALATLTKVDHQLDPECLSCHVTGAAYRRGFQSLASTPQLAFVGCESCHGPGLAHALDPRRFRLKKVGSESCENCHAPLNSPHFDFAHYWPRVRHNR